MSMEMVAWHSMDRAANDHQEQRPFSMVTLRRIAAFARPHRRRLAAFLTLDYDFSAPSETPERQ